MKVHLPILGKATGSSAGLIYQSYWGNTYTRSFPFSFHYPDTDKQQKCQFDFFKIQRVWWEIYDKMKESIPRIQRNNRNVFDVLSAGIYKTFMTYAPKDKSKVLEVWGLDVRKSVKMSIEFGKISAIGKNFTADATVLSIAGKRKFVPSLVHVLMCNIDKQELYYKWEPYRDPQIYVSYYIDSDWQVSDLIIAYMAFSNNEFFTNFYLMSE